MRVRVVVGVALALVAVALVVVLSQSGQRLAGTNGIRTTGFPVVLEPGRAACQAAIVVDDAAAVELLVGTYGRRLPPLSVAFAPTGGGRPVRGSVPGGGGEGDVTIQLDATADGAEAAELCVRNRGDVRIALGGDVSAPAAAATVGRSATAGVIAVRYLRSGDESWWQLAPTIATRFGVGKAPLLGSWTLPFAILLLLGAWVVALRLLLRGERT